MKAQPIAELESAHKNFRFSVAQRMLYNDESSKKRTISSLAEQRQQITSLSPHQNHQQISKRIKLDEQAEEGSQYETSDDYLNNHQQLPKRAKLELGDEQIKPQQQQENGNGSQYEASQDYLYSGTSDPGYAISSSLNYVYGDSNTYVVPEDTQQPIIFTFEHGFQMPPNFVNFARNSQESWNAPLCLEEQYDPNARCFYPKHLVYPGNGQEYSLEELKAQKWLKKEENRKQEQFRMQQEAEALRLRQEQERLRQEQEAKRLIEEQERIRNEQEALRVRMMQEKLHQKQQEEVVQQEVPYQSQIPYQQPAPSWNVHAQSPANYGSYYQHNYENSTQYSYSHDHRYQSHLAQQQQQQQQQMYQHSPQQYHSPNYQNSPNYHQQQSVIVNRSQYENQQVQHPPAGAYYQQQYSGGDYQAYQQTNAQPQDPIATQSQPNANVAVTTGEAAAAAAVNPLREEPDYQDVEYLIDHQGEIDPNMLQQPIIESFENGDEDDDEGSSYEESDEEPYSGPAPVVNSFMLDDLEEQIEASTISFSSNGKSRDKKITIKFRKEKTTTTVIHSESNSESSTPVRSNTAPSTKNSLEPSSTSSSSSKKKSRKQKFQREILNTFDGDNTQFMPSATNSCSSTATGEFNASFGNISFNGCVTPMRKPVSSKTSTPVSTYKVLKKPESVISIHNDDSRCSYSGDQNSFFQAENDEELKGRRLDRALATIDEHLNRRNIDPFNSELCRAFLTKLNFPNRENTADYKITNVNLPKLSRNQIVPISGVNYQIEKEVGRGSYGAVYR